MPYLNIEQTKRFSLFAFKSSEDEYANGHRVGFFSEDSEFCDTDDPETFVDALASVLAYEYGVGETEHEIFLRTTGPIETLNRLHQQALENAEIIKQEKARKQKAAIEKQKAEETAKAKRLEQYEKLKQEFS